MSFDHWGSGAGAARTYPLVDGVEGPDLSACNVSFDVDLFTGSASASVSLRAPDGRDGFGPDLRLRYGSRQGQGVFGLGWSLDVASVERTARVSVPAYDETDTFELAGEELVPALANGSQWSDDVFEVGEYAVRRYRRRFEGVPVRIEHWAHKLTHQSHWRTVDADNVTCLYGVTAATRVFDPDEPLRVARWLLAERFDDRGNVVRYTYKGENDQGAAKYLKRVLYGNYSPHERGPWHFEVVLDYGEHDLEHPDSHESGAWSLRPDPVSDRRAGFEQTMWRRCRRLLVFHRSEELGHTPYLVSATELTYEVSHGVSVLTKVDQAGYVWSKDGDPQSRRLPSKTFGYTDAGTPQERVIDSPDLAAALSHGDGPSMWIDYHEEGISGVLQRRDDEWHYVRNIGGARFAATEVVPFEQAVDAEEVANEAVAHDATYRPHLAGDGSVVAHMDLNGDGVEDMVVTSPDGVRWYPSAGRDGYSAARAVHLRAGDRRRSHRLGRSNGSSVHLADMTGDGVHDLVCVGPGEVAYWPGLGDGRFGDRVEMQSAPEIEGTALRGVHFGDLSGSGTADLLLATDGTLRFWPNRAGLVFGDQESVAAAGMTPANVAGTLDLLGRNCEAVVWLDTTRDVPAVRYISSVAGSPTGLLKAIDNGAGHTVTLGWTSSTDAWRRDRDAGREWLFPSSVPVQVVETTETKDAVAGTGVVRRHTYRHASYESAKQKLTGFAVCELSEMSSNGPDYQRIPQTTTRTWFHTGDTLDGIDMAEELVGEFHTDSRSGRHRWLPSNRLPAENSPKEAEAALQGLRGLLLRQELYGSDPKSPLRVREQSGCLHRVQPAREDRMASLRAHAAETVDVIYDGMPEDPRIVHTMVLDVDHCGQVLQQATIHYGRAEAEVDGQGETRVLVEEREVVNEAGQATWHRIGVPVAEARWELTQLPQRETGLFELGPIKDMATSGDASLLNSSRYIYWSNDLSHVLGPGEIESRAVFARKDRLAFTSGTARPVIDDDTDALLSHEGGYQRAGEDWWAPGVSRQYDAAHFYRLVAERNALGHETKYRYDVTFLHCTAVEDGYGNLTSWRVHPRAQRWWSRTDANGVTVARRFDALGNVLSVAVSSGREGDRLDESSLEAVSSDDPTAVITYSSEPGGAWAWLRQRQEHGIRPMVLSEQRARFDSTGALLQRAERHGGGSWRMSVLVERDGRGDVTRRAPPFYAEEDLLVDEERALNLDNGDQLSYDELGRLVRLHHPDGTFDTWRHEPWKQVDADANDNVIDSSWYADRQGAAYRAGDFGNRRSARQVFEARAAAQAATHADTPAVAHLGPAGLVIARHDGSRDVGATRYRSDVTGHVTRVVDPAGRELLSRSFDLLGRLVSERHIDRGESVEVRSASGELLRRQNAGGTVVRYRYDAAGRLTHVWELRPEEDNERLVERFVWGGGETGVEDAAGRGLVGRLHMHLGSAGLELFDRYDHMGRPITVKRHAPEVGADHQLDWSMVADVRNAGEVLQLLCDPSAPRLQQEALEATSRRDTIGRAREHTGPDGRVLHAACEGQLDESDIGMSAGGEEPAPLAGSVEYDAGRRLAGARASAGLRLLRSYDPRGRLREATVSQGDGEPSVQDAQFMYDAEGNATSVSSGGELVASFTYDASYRLVRAEGLEPRGPEGGVRRFANAYLLDDAGNLVEIQHSATGVEWQRRYYYEARSNRLVGAGNPEDEPGEIEVSFVYDAAGNVIAGPGGDEYRWDHDNRLVSAARKGDTVVYGYDLDGEIARRVVFRIDGTVDETIACKGTERTRRFVGGDVRDEDWETTVALGGLPALSLRHEGNSAPAMSVYATDQMQSVVIEAAPDTLVLTEQDFMPFGIPWVRQARPFEVNYMRLGFRGGRHDLDTRMLWTAGRWYSPWSGRHLSPHGPSSGINGYLMADGNPQWVPSTDST